MPLHTQFSSRPNIGRPLAALAGGVGAVVLIAACSSGSGSGSTPTGSPSSSPSQQAGVGSGRGAGPGAAGTIAEVAAGSIEVQNQSTGQVTVKYTAKTAFVQVKSTTEAAVKPGTCVLAAAAPSQTASGSPSPASPPSTTFTAATVFLSQRENGKCTLADLGGGARTGGSRAPRSGQFPSGFPTGARRSGANGRNFGFAERAAGAVTAVSGSTITVSGTNPRTNAAVTYTVDVDASTKYSQTVATTSKALAVGQCASATGRADDTGAVTATSIRLSPPTNGNCTIGFGGGRRPFGGPSSTDG